MSINFRLIFKINLREEKKKLHLLPCGKKMEFPGERLCMVI